VRDDVAEPEESEERARLDAIALCPLAASAGREFPLVIVLDVNRGSFPRTRAALAEHERAGADEDARRALHLAMTRATEELILLATESTRSPLLPLKKLVVERTEAGIFLPPSRTEA
jgi:superfamily I DNA/RNA helicase